MLVLAYLFGGDKRFIVKWIPHPRVFWTTILDFEEFFLNISPPEKLVKKFRNERFCNRLSNIKIKSGGQDFSGYLLHFP